MPRANEDLILKAALGPSTGGKNLRTRAKGVSTCGRPSVYRCVVQLLIPCCDFCMHERNTLDT